MPRIDLLIAPEWSDAKFTGNPVARSAIDAVVVPETAELFADNLLTK